MKYPVILAGFKSNLNILDIFSKKKKTQTSYFMKILQVAAELFHADRHDEDNNRSSQYCEQAYVLPTQGISVFCRFFPPPPPMSPHVLMNFRGFPPGCGDSVADF